MKDLITRQDGSKYLLEWFEDCDYSDLDNITQVYGFLFDNHGNICVVNHGSSWRLPGGGIEKEDKDWRDTLKREAIEEADVEIKDIVPLGYIKVTPLNSSEKIHYLIRAIGRVFKINKQTIDISEGVINQRKFILAKDFSNYCAWGNFGDFIKDRAVEKFSN